MEAPVSRAPRPWSRGLVTCRRAVGRIQPVRSVMIPNVIASSPKNAPVPTAHAMASLRSDRKRPGTRVTPSPKMPTLSLNPVAPDDADARQFPSGSAAICALGAQDPPDRAQAGGPALQGAARHDRTHRHQRTRGLVSRTPIGMGSDCHLRSRRNRIAAPGIRPEASAGQLPGESGRFGKPVDRVVSRRAAPLATRPARNAARVLPATDPSRTFLHLLPFRPFGQHLRMRPLVRVMTPAPLVSSL